MKRFMLGLVLATASLFAVSGASAETRGVVFENPLDGQVIARHQDLSVQIHIAGWANDVATVTLTANGDQLGYWTNPADGVVAIWPVPAANGKTYVLTATATFTDSQQVSSTITVTSN